MPSGKQTVYSHNFVTWILTKLLQIAKLCFVCCKWGCHTWKTLECRVGQKVWLAVGCNIILKIETWIWVISKEASLYLGFFSPLLFPSFLGRSSIGLFPFLSLKASAPVHLMGEALRAIIAQQFPRPWNCCSFQITWISLHQHHLCLPACANLQFKSLHCAFFFFPKKNRRFLLQYLVGNSKKRGTARVSHRHSIRNPTSQRTSVFSSSDRKEKKLHTRVHVTFSFLQCQLANCWYIYTPH